MLIVYPPSPQLTVSQLCFNMEEMLTEEHGKCLEYIKHWLNSIHQHAHEAPILLIGTHGDAVQSHVEHEGINKTLVSALRNHPSWRRLVFNDRHKFRFFPVANKQKMDADPEDELKIQLRNLRTVIEETAQKQSFMHSVIPFNWLAFVDAVKRKSSTEHLQRMSRQQVQEVFHDRCA